MFGGGGGGKSGVSRMFVTLPLLFLVQRIDMTQERNVMIARAAYLVVQLVCIFLIYTISKVRGGGTSSSSRNQPPCGVPLRL